MLRYVERVVYFCVLVLYVLLKKRAGLKTLGEAESF